MSLNQPQCPYCRERMELGFVLDKANGNARFESKWVEGKPDVSFWTGVKLKGKKLIPIQSYRCSRCGFLAHYAVNS